MLYFKNSEITKTYHVALNTVLNWIKSAEQGKLDIELVPSNGRSYIANTAKNTTMLDEMVNARRKFRNGRTYRTVEPLPEFYELYTETQIHEIISALETFHEADRQYTYFGEGAHLWDKYVHKMESDNDPNFLNRTLRLIEVNKRPLEELIAPYKKVNIIDVGIGNAVPVKDMIADFISREIMGRYIGLDISSEMLNIARQNLNSWFGDQLKFEDHLLDITKQRFSTLVSDEYFKPKDERAINLILLFGGTISNFKSPEKALGMIQDSMGKDDILVVCHKLDTLNSRRYFDFGTGPMSQSPAEMHRFLLDKLGITPDLYDMEIGYDEKAKQRYVRVRLNVSIMLSVKFKRGVRSLNFNKGESIHIWRYWHQDSQDLEKLLIMNNFYPFVQSQLKDREYAFIMAGVGRTRLVADSAVA